MIFLPSPFLGLWAFFISKTLEGTLNPRLSSTLKLDPVPKYFSFPQLIFPASFYGEFWPHFGLSSPILDWPRNISANTPQSRCSYSFNEGTRSTSAISWGNILLAVVIELYQRSRYNTAFLIEFFGKHQSRDSERVKH